MMWQNLVVVFLANVISNSLSTLKTLFISKKIMKPVYLIVFLDAIIFISGFKIVTQENSVWFVLAFALGKVIGVYIADLIENKIALGTLEVVIYAKKEKAIKIADTLRNMGYTVTTHVGYGLQGNKRFCVAILIDRKEYFVLKDILKKFGYTEATMFVREIKHFSGKITPNGNVDLIKVSNF